MPMRPQMTREPQPDGGVILKVGGKVVARGEMKGGVLYVHAEGRNRKERRANETRFLNRKGKKARLKA